MIIPACQHWPKRCSLTRWTHFLSALLNFPHALYRCNDTSKPSCVPFTFIPNNIFCVTGTLEFQWALDPAVRDPVMKIKVDLPLMRSPDRHVPLLHGICQLTSQFTYILTWIFGMPPFYLELWFFWHFFRCWFWSLGFFMRIGFFFILEAFSSNFLLLCTYACILISHILINVCVHVLTYIFYCMRDTHRQLRIRRALPPFNVSLRTRKPLSL